MMANESAMTMGGTILSDEQELALNEDASQYLASKENKSTFGKFFDLYDYKNPMSRFVASIQGSSPIQSVIAMSQEVSTQVSTLVTGQTFAAATPSSTFYGVPKIGYDQRELNKEIYADPFDNANIVYEALTKDAGKKQYFEDCTGMTITDDFNFVTRAFEDADNPVAMYMESGFKESCKNMQTDEILYRTSILALDTQVLNSFACMELDDDEACQDIDSTTTSSGTVAGIGANCVTTGLTAPEENYSKTKYDGNTVNKRTYGMLKAAEKIYGKSFKVSQGSYNAGGVSASAGTHDGGGAIDISASELSNEERQNTVKALRQVGFAAWLRTPAQANWGYHIHAIAIGDTDLSPGAQSQVEDYFNGFNGLAGNGKDSHPNIGRPIPEWATKFGDPLCPK
jgi:hypothetical protein